MVTIARKSWTDQDGLIHKNDIFAVPFTGADGKTHYSLAACSGLEAYAQALEAVVQTLRGELQLDTEAGIPYFETVFASNQLIGQWAEAVRDAVKAKPFVKSIDGFVYSFDSSEGKLNYRLAVTTDIGDLEITSED